MLSVGVYFINLFTLSVSTLNFFFQFWLLRDGNVIFYSLMIFFINSTFLLCSRVKKNAEMLGFLMAWYSIFSVSIL